MLLLSRSWMLVLAGCLAACTACQREQAKGPKPTSKDPANVKVKADKRQSPAPSAENEKHPAAKQPAQKPPSPLMIPKVALSDETRAACLVNVGDVFPSAKLADISGKVHGLASMYGQKLTVVCCWTVGTTPRAKLVAVATLQDLMHEVAEPFAEQGIRVVAINVGDPVTEVQKDIEQAEIGLPTLLDQRGELFAKLADDKRMPRTFLLDADGKILWFDVEFSRSSRQDLIQGIRAALGEL